MSKNLSVIAQQKVTYFKGMLNDKSVQAQIKNSMKENAGAFMSSLLDLYVNDDSLQGCDPQLVMMEALKACALKLPIVKALGFAYVVPYKKKPTFTIGYKGLIQLAQRTGQYKYINSGVVFEGMLKETNPLTGELDITGERKGDKVIGYFAYIELLNGFKKSVYMTLAECTAWGKKYSPSYSSSFSPWKSEFDKMAMKTCLRQLISIFGVMSTDMMAIVSSEIDKETDHLHAEVQEGILNPFDSKASQELDEEIIEQEGEANDTNTE